jgi:hypothetical protein
VKAADLDRLAGGLTITGGPLAKGHPHPLTGEQLAAPGANLTDRLNALGWALWTAVVVVVFVQSVSEAISSSSITADTGRPAFLGCHRPRPGTAVW